MCLMSFRGRTATVRHSEAPYGAENFKNIVLRTFSNNYIHLQDNFGLKIDESGGVVISRKKIDLGSPLSTSRSMVRTLSAETAPGDS